MSGRASPFSLWFETAVAMNAAALTISMRLFRMQQAILLGDPTGGAESRRMVIEKVLAAQHGYWRGAEAVVDLMFERPGTADYWSKVSAVPSAALRPGFSKARSNARRLTKLR